jgi:hypothetical protein
MRRTLFPIFLLSLVFTFSSVSVAAAPNEWAMDAARGYHEVLLKCPERIWPGMDWSKTQFLFASHDSKQAWLISAANPLPELLSASEVPDIAYVAAFTFVNFRGLETVTIALDRYRDIESSTPFDLAVHEMFHHVGQKGWASAGGGRGTLVPLDFEPRYLRAEMAKALKAAYRDSSQLRSAANWYEEWSRRYPHEVKSTTDGYEGTARYVDAISRILRKKTCLATDAEIQAEVVSLLDGFLPFSGMELDSEGYGMGALAGFLMDQLGMEWKSGAALGRTPVTQLLEGKATNSPVVDPLLKKEFQETFGQVNQEIDQWRLPFELNLQNKNFVRIAVTSDWIRGSFSPKGFFIPKDDPIALYTPFNGEHQFQVASGDWISVADSAVGYRRNELNECESSAWYFLVPRSEIQEDRSKFTAKNQEITFEVNGTLREGKDGFVYLCPTILAMGSRSANKQVRSRFN